MKHYLMNNYGKPELAFEKGEGCYLYATDGRRFLDALSGISVCNLGHAHAAISNAISAQSQKLIHTSNLYQIPLQQELAQCLVELAGMDNVFFANSGAEANEAAIKLSRLHGTNKGFSSPKVIVAERSFHGRTMAALSATGNVKAQQGFEPLVEGFIRVPYNDLAAIEQCLQQHDDISAILIEPVQGEGGINIPDEGFLRSLRKLCDDNDVLMMLDEVQAGMCRTGKWFAFQHEEIQPDVMTLAKALGNGVPMGACLARGKAAELFQPGHHGSTFGGNPLAASAALATIRTMQEIDACQLASRMGEYLCQGFRGRLAGIDAVVDIRAKGLMIGIELDRACSPLVSMCAERELLINVTAERVIRLLPPLIMNREQADELLSKLTDAITTFIKND